MGRPGRLAGRQCLHHPRQATARLGWATFWTGLQDLGSEIGGRRHGGGSGLPQSSADVKLRPDAFWAVKDVSFPVAHTPHLVSPTPKFLSALDRLPPGPPGAPARTNPDAAAASQG
ncbi:MAG: hypothetical protein ACKOPS_13140, partial [Cyanobium sp.]